MKAKMLYELMLRSAERFPEAEAIRHAGGSWSYRELLSCTLRIAAAWKSAGIAPGDRVALWGEKSPELVAGMQAALLLGAAYIPLDPFQPAARVRRIVAGCQLRSILCAPERFRSLELPGLHQLDPAILPESGSVIPHRGDPGRESAYILYSSGSTGDPKGICLSHANALAFVHWAGELLQPEQGHRFANHAPFHFDLSVLDLYCAFHCGGSVSLVPEGFAYAPEKLVAFLREEKIRHWYSVPSALVLMTEKGGLLQAELPHLRTVIFAGEPFPPPVLRRIRERFPGLRYLNFYGPTETNVCTWHELRPDETLDKPLPIGRAACGDTVWLQTPEGERIEAPGIEGELFVRGPSVMLGYWGREPAPACYATGDLACWNERGELEFRGRRDFQIKLRGFRIHPGEVESALLRAAGVQEAVVLVEGEGLSARLIACVVPSAGCRPGLLALKRSCAEQLPTYMIPQELRLFAELPRTSTGKVDRKALSATLRGEAKAA